MLSLNGVQAYSGQYNTARAAGQLQENQQVKQLDQGTPGQKLQDDIAAVQQVNTVAQSGNGISTQVANDGSTSSNTSLASMKESMSATATSTRAGVSSGYNAADLYSFHNQYLYGTSSNTWARIDTEVDSQGKTDGVWSRSELQAYATAYEKATGKSLDVDALFDKYDTGNKGYLDYFDQKKMYEDDALGISYANDLKVRADMGLSTVSNPNKVYVNQKALDSFVKDYTYGYPGKMYANIDKDAPGTPGAGLWSKDELADYAKALYSATGIKLDVDALFAKYDTGNKGYLDYFDQNAMYKDDALGLSAVKNALDSANSSSAGKDKGPSIDDKELGNSIQNFWSSLSGSQKKGLATAFSQSIQKAAMLDAFSTTNNIINQITYGGKSGAFGGSSGTYSAWNWANLNMLSMFM